MFNYGRLEDIIEEVKNARDAWIFDEYGNIKYDVYCVDIIPVLERLKEYEADDIREDDAEYMFENYDKADNSYNWNANISHCFEYRTKELDGENYVMLSVHLSGDARCNYTDFVVLKMDIYELFELEEWYDYKDLDDNGHYTIDINGLSETYTVYDNELQEDLGEYYELERADLIKALHEDGKCLEIK